MSKVIEAIPIIVFFACLAYVKWRFSPPDDIIGSHLENTDHRARQLLRAAKEQHYREMWHRGDPS